MQLLELAAKARVLYDQQPAVEKRLLLDSLCSNSCWTTDGLQVEFRQPFDMIAAAAVADEQKEAAGAASDDLSASWLPVIDAIRKLSCDPSWRIEIVALGNHPLAG